jgi:uncharacterized protein (DUF58 family)
MMIPSRRLVLVGALTFGLALAVFANHRLWPALVATDLAIALVAAVDALWARRGFVEVERLPPATFSIGRSNVVELTLTSRARRTLTVAITDDLFPSARAEGLPATLVLPAGASATVRYVVRPTERGAFALGDHHLRWSSPLGLWQRQRRQPARHAVRVYPDLQAVRSWELLARQDREHALWRTVRLRGGETEFERLREYQRDDEFRNIDWKATARHQKLITREHQLERNQSLIFALDCGRLMTAESDGLSQLDHALNASLMLAHVALRLGDHVGQLAFDAEVRRFVAPAAGRSSSQRFMHASYDLQPRPCETDYRVAQTQLALRARKRSLVVLFTQVIDDLGARELVRFAKGLLPRHLALVVLFRDSDVEQLAEAPGVSGPRPPAIDQCVAAAAAEHLVWRERLIGELKRGGVLTLDVVPRQLTAALVHQYLEIKARQLL